MKRLVLIFVLFLSAGGGLADTVAAAPAATFTVNQTADLPDANVADGRCDTSSSITGDQCSLRAAIQQSNGSAVVDTIKFVSSAAHKITRSGNDDLASLGDLDITRSVNIEGRAPSTTIDGNRLDRVFDVLGGTVMMKDLVVLGGNTNAFGGGYQVRANANLTLINVVVRNNFAADNSGGIENFGSLTLDQVSIVSNNTNDFLGGIRSTDNLTMLNSTVADNEGVQAVFVGTALLENSTFGGMNAVGLVSLRNVTTNFLGNCDPSFGCGNPGATNLFNSIVGICDGTYSSLGYNLIQDASNCTLTGNHAGNLLNVNPLLGPLQNNGGPTKTRALLAGSPAIDAGNPAGCAGLNGENLTTDQRGFPRPTDGNGDGTPRCDIGAFESGAVGIGSVSPDRGSSAAGEQIVFDVIWDSPTRWRDLDTVDLRFKRKGDIILWLRFTEGLPDSTFSFLDAEGNVIDSGTAGKAGLLKGEFGVLHLAASGFTASGPDDPHVVIHYAVTFKPEARGKLNLQIRATDDFGNRQPWEPAGTWRVRQ